MTGLIFGAIAVMWLAYLVPWFATRADHEELADPNSAKFADSLRFITDDILDEAPSAEVSTPLTRKAQLAELKLISLTAARRRRRVLFSLLALATGLAALSAFGVIAWWASLIPVGLIVVFLGIARFSVVAMQKRLDARADYILSAVDEETNVIALADEEASVRLELSIDLTPEVTSTSLLDPIPVTTPTYVSLPLAPRTVRTIDLSSPSANTELIVPTADALRDETEPIDSDDLPRAVNE